jgi:hypothetical protein
MTRPLRREPGGVSRWCAVCPRPGRCRGRRSRRPAHHAPRGLPAKCACRRVRGVTSDARRRMTAAERSGTSTGTRTTALIGATASPSTGRLVRSARPARRDADNPSAQFSACTTRTMSGFSNRRTDERNNASACAPPAPSTTSTGSQPASARARAACTTHGSPDSSTARAFGPPNRVPAPAASSSPAYRGPSGPALALSLAVALALALAVPRLRSLGRMPAIVGASARAARAASVDRQPWSVTSVSSRPTISLATTSMPTIRRTP